jgi:PhnB protein
MTPRVKPIPDGLNAAIPYLCVKGAAQAIEFYQQAFGAIEKFRMADPSGKVGHAEMTIGDAHFYLADEFPELGFKSPAALGGSPVLIHLYVEDVDAFVRRAAAAGARITRPLETQFYGDRGAQLVDPFGHSWWFASHVEDVSPEELERRSKAPHGAAG